jgi:hypothetical protein
VFDSVEADDLDSDSASDGRKTRNKQTTPTRHVKELAHAEDKHKRLKALIDDLALVGQQLTLVLSFFTVNNTTLPDAKVDIHDEMLTSYSADLMRKLEMRRCGESEIFLCHGILWRWKKEGSALNLVSQGEVFVSLNWTSSTPGFTHDKDQDYDNSEIIII